MTASGAWRQVFTVVYRRIQGFSEGLRPLGLPYWLARGDPGAPRRSPGSLAAARSRCL